MTWETPAHRPTRGLGRGGALLVVVLALTACDGTGARAGDAAAVGAAPTGTPARGEALAPVVRIAPGTASVTLEQALGAPTARRPLKNDQPSLMGAAVIDYAFTDPVIRFLDRDGGEVARGRALQIVVDPDGRVLRLVPDPNTPGPAGTRTLRGSPVLPHAAEIPAGVTVRRF